MEPTTSLPIFAPLFVVILVIVLAKRRRRRRLLALRATPAPGAARLALDALVVRLNELAPPDAPFQFIKEAAGITLTWQLHGIPWATLLFRRKLRDTQAIDLRFENDGRALASFREGRIEWETAAATWMPRAKVTWKPVRDVGSIPPHDPNSPPAAPTAESPRDLRELVLHVRRVIVEAGWIFEPVLHSPA